MRVRFRYCHVDAFVHALSIIVMLFLTAFTRNESADTCQFYESKILILLFLFFLQKPFRISSNKQIKHFRSITFVVYTVRSGQNLFPDSCKRYVHY